MRYASRRCLTFTLDDRHAREWQSASANERRTIVFATLLVAAPILFVADQAARTLRTLEIVERERDTWQRPDEVISRLNVVPGSTVVDLGAGAGYFALKLAPRVAPDGRVLAVDLRRQSLAFLWLRAALRRQSRVRVVHGEAADPGLPPGPVDAVLIANTFFELSAPASMLDTLFRTMRPGAMLVIVDHQQRAGSRGPDHGHHDVPAADAERQITSHGFRSVLRDERFIDRAIDDHMWWLLTFRRP